MKTFLYVVACVWPMSDPQVDCREVAEYEPPNPIQCQFDRILVSSVWRDRIKANYGDGYVVFTGCDGPAVEELLK